MGAGPGLRQGSGLVVSQMKDKLGRFELVKWLGRGSQGVVYLARDPRLDRLVAIKLLIPDDKALEGFHPEDGLNEGRLASRLTHPNIVTVFEAGSFSGTDYLVFEYVEGKTLSDLLRQRGALSIEEACGFIGPILDGIGHAHARGVLHLDLSPRNILIDQAGTPRIMDFGLAQSVSTSRRSTDMAVGTLRYMAPEHFSGGDFGTYTDVFSLGSTVLELVTGRPVMQGTTPRSVVSRILHTPIDFDALKSQEHGEAFSHFVQGALEKDPECRYRDGSAMKAAFHTFSQGAGLTQAATSGDSTIEYLLRRMRRKGDFPSLSRSFVELNRLTNDDANAPADKIANLILRDYALANKILKLVNSAFYRPVAGEVTNVSQAIVLLGLRQVRLAANSLAFFSHMRDRRGCNELRNVMTRSFLAGLLTRFLARRILPVCPEDAFICGMFRNLGECLVAYYFPEEYREITELVTDGGVAKQEAAGDVLGVSLAKLGARVAENWNLPGQVVDIIAAEHSDTVGVPATPDESLRDIAILCNELCDIAGRNDPPAQHVARLELLNQFSKSISLPENSSMTLLSAALDKLERFAPIMELDFESGDFYHSARFWTDWHAHQQESAVIRAAAPARPQASLPALRTSAE